jgi:hypothetical protein
MLDACSLHASAAAASFCLLASAAPKNKSAWAVSPKTKSDAAKRNGINTQAGISTNASNAKSCSAQKDLGKSFARLSVARLQAGAGL